VLKRRCSTTTPKKHQSKGALRVCASIIATEATTIPGKAIRHATRPTWAEVSLPALRRNFGLVQQHVGPDVTICAVV
jgi:hypothetical protein